jgi:hypothetical protein
MKSFHDLFVGAVAVLVGCAFLAGAVLQGTWLMTLAKFRLLAESLGETTARRVVALVGAALIVLGILIAGGWRWHW